MVIDSINHEGTGDCNLKIGFGIYRKITLDMDKVNYMQNVPVTLDAVLGIDLVANILSKKTKH
jgi:hypothetical protein